MIPFNLEEYLKNPSRKIITRGGRKIKRVLCTDARGPYPVIVLMERPDIIVDEAHSYTKDGKFCSGETHPFDLFFAPEKHEGWAHIFRDATGNSYMGLQIFKSKEAAEKDGEKYNLYVTTVKIEWEE